jgi:hypothetical protein
MITGISSAASLAALLIKRNCAAGGGNGVLSCENPEVRRGADAGVGGGGVAEMLVGGRRNIDSEQPQTPIRQDHLVSL